MRKYLPHLLVLVTLFTAGYFALAQEREEAGQRQSPGNVQSGDQLPVQSQGIAGGSAQGVVVNFSELAKKELLSPTAYKEPKAVREPRPAPRRKAVSVENGAVLEVENPQAANYPGAQPLAPSPALASSFKALEDSNASIPPDTHGAVGPNHLMVTLNTQLRIQTRTGAALSTVTLDSFWSPLGNPNSFDPKVLYDPYSNRWMLTATGNADSATSCILIAVSQTSDPTGTWKLYKVDADATNTVWADYPSIGFNKNWIVVTVNMFGIADGTFKRSQIYAFNKAVLYAFGASASHKRFDDANGFTMAPAITYDNVINEMYLVEDWDGQKQLRVSSITGTTGSTPAYSATHTFPTAPAGNYWTYAAPNGDDFGPQLGSTQKIQTNDSRVQNVVYRGGSLWCVQTIFLPAGPSPTRSAIQWWQLSTAGAIQQRGRIDDPTGAKFYAFPSIAVNKNKDVLIGYSRFWSQQYASAYYSFRAGTDPVNTLRTEAVLKAGSATYDKDFGGGRNRWGDYSSTVVDPANDLDMWTVQEHATTASGGFSRWGTWWGRISLGAVTPTPFIQRGTTTATDGNTGDADTLIEPGETGNKLIIQLKNTGSGAATAVSGKLTTTTPGVTITVNTSPYPNLAATSGAGNNSTAFQFNVASTVPCGQAINFTLTVTYTGGGSPTTLPFTIPTGKAGVPVTKARTGTAVAIPDNTTAGVNIPFAVSGLPTKLADINFMFGGTTCSTDPASTAVGLNHSWVGDLVVTLKSPQGTVVTLINQAGGVNNEGRNFCKTTLDDEAVGSSIQSISPGGSPYTGSFKPNSPLSAFDGQNPNGTWTLNVSDRAAQDTGSVRAFSLIITPSATCSLTASASPIEVQVESALASSSTDAAPEPLKAVWAGALGFATMRESGQTREHDSAELFGGAWLTPRETESETLSAASMFVGSDHLVRLLSARSGGNLSSP